jgi:sarcosine oxidase, subunit beta
VPERAGVLILGAGIAGCALAHHLVDLDVAPVAVYDPRTPAAGATGRAAGIVTEQLWNAWDAEVTRESKRQYAELAERWDASAYSVNGFVRWAHGRDAVRSLDAATERQRSWGVTVRELDAHGLAERVPHGKFESGARGTYSSDDAIVSPSTMAELFAESARSRGAEFVFGTPLGALDHVAGSWELTSGARTIRAHELVVAAGAWSKSLLDRLGHPLPLAPYRTQAAVLRPAGAGPSSFPSIHDIDTDVYARPEGNGRVLAGDGTELVEVDPETARLGADPTFVERLAETFAERMPGWADAELVRAWAGVCVSTPDRRPLVGAVDGARGLWALTGFNGFGVMRAGGVARRLAESIAGGGHGNRELERLRPVEPSRFRGPVRPFSPRPGFTLDDGDDPRY